MTGPSTSPSATGQEGRWQGINAHGAPLVAHLVATDSTWSGSFLSLCGRERRRNWEPVEDFARPEVFARCERCQQIGARP